MTLTVELDFFFKFIYILRRLLCKKLVGEKFACKFSYILQKTPTCVNPQSNLPMKTENVVIL